ARSGDGRADRFPGRAAHPLRGGPDQPAVPTLPSRAHFPAPLPGPAAAGERDAGRRSGAGPLSERARCPAPPQRGPLLSPGVCPEIAAGPGDLALRDDPGAGGALEARLVRGSATALPPRTVRGGRSASRAGCLSRRAPP